MKPFVSDFQQKNIWNRAGCQRSENIKNTQKVKKKAIYLGKTIQNVWIFKEILFFKAMYNTQKNNSLLKVACLWKEEGTRLVPSSFPKHPTLKDKWSFCVVRSFEKENFLEKYQRLPLCDIFCSLFKVVLKEGFSSILVCLWLSAVFFWFCQKGKTSHAQRIHFVDCYPSRKFTSFDESDGFCTAMSN